MLLITGEWKRNGSCCLCTSPYYTHTNIYVLICAHLGTQSIFSITIFHPTSIHICNFTFLIYRLHVESIIIWWVVFDRTDRVNSMSIFPPLCVLWCGKMNDFFNEQYSSSIFNSWGIFLSYGNQKRPIYCQLLVSSQYASENFLLLLRLQWKCVFWGCCVMSTSIITCNSPIWWNTWITKEKKREIIINNFTWNKDAHVGTTLFQCLCLIFIFQCGSQITSISALWITVTCTWAQQMCYCIWQKWVLIRQQEYGVYTKMNICYQAAWVAVWRRVIIIL